MLSEKVVLLCLSLKRVKKKRRHREEKKMKYVLVTGGVVSGLGKGVTASSIGLLLKACGLRVTAIKIGIFFFVYFFFPFGNGKWIKHAYFFIHETLNSLSQFSLSRFSVFFSGSFFPFIFSNQGTPYSFCSKCKHSRTIEPRI